MTAIRRTGNVTVRISYNEQSPFANGDYRCVIVADGQRSVMTVGTPACLTESVDSVRSFDHAAQAAIAFAIDEGRTDLDPDYDADGCSVAFKRR